MPTFERGRLGGTVALKEANSVSLSKAPENSRQVEEFDWDLATLNRDTPQPASDWDLATLNRNFQKSNPSVTDAGIAESIAAPLSQQSLPVKIGSVLISGREQIIRDALGRLTETEAKRDGTLGLVRANAEDIEALVTAVNSYMAVKSSDVMDPNQFRTLDRYLKDYLGETWKDQEERNIVSKLARAVVGYEDRVETAKLEKSMGNASSLIIESEVDRLTITVSTESEIDPLSGYYNSKVA